MSSRSKLPRSALAFAVLTSVALVGGLTTATTASAAPTFQAAGSAKQVYVTGLAPSTPMSLVNSAGKTIVNAKMGVRVGFGDLLETGWFSSSDLYVGYGRALTGDVWYRDILRVEYRVRF